MEINLDKTYSDLIREIAEEMKKDIADMVDFCGGYVVVDSDCCEVDCAPGYGYIYGVFKIEDNYYVVYDKQDLNNIIDANGNIILEPENVDCCLLDDLSNDFICSLYESVETCTKEYEMVHVIG